MTYKPTTFFDKIFKDKDGKIVIWQNPNIALWGWIIFTILTYIVKRGRINKGSQSLASAFLFTWAYLEVLKGDSIFRRVLGAVVLINIVVSFFM